MKRYIGMSLAVSLAFLLTLLGFSSVNAQEEEKEEIGKVVIVVKYVDMPSDRLLNPPVPPGMTVDDVPPWKETGAVDLVLSSAPSTLPGRRFKTAINSAKVKALHNGKDIFILLKWGDGTRSTVSSPSDFTDGAAVELPLVIGPTLPSYKMGQKDAYVNIIYWRPDLRNPQNIIAGGGANSTATDDRNLSANGSWRMGQWMVIFSRPLKTGSDSQTQLTPGVETFISFGIWDGGDSQRDGHKSVSFWQPLRLEK